MKKLLAPTDGHSDKEKIRELIMQEAKNFCDMINCVDDPPCLEYNISQDGIKISITAEIE